ncbi:hypothetical protein [Paenibacillus dendritiformis]|uniref:hypothetical protein n=1 Tax=Paenibacillus dendritiformis TaxID=130049 RepID=UPI0005951283|nr:hypothetical protein [Paenibacillus dendritiformis]
MGWLTLSEQVGRGASGRSSRRSGDAGVECGIATLPIGQEDAGVEYIMASLPSVREWAGTKRVYNMQC